jgi:hypothetical protein
MEGVTEGDLGGVGMEATGVGERVGKEKEVGREGGWGAVGREVKEVGDWVVEGMEVGKEGGWVGEGTEVRDWVGWVVVGMGLEGWEKEVVELGVGEWQSLL